jgi:D-tyrosyl-tRNA(Tyr) deacylase
MDLDYEILLVSQFTLQANLQKGQKPDFHNAMATGPAREAFAECVEMFRNMYQPDKIQTGRFGEMMKVALENDGPVTLILE